jgi:YD repeat-containing protein
MLTYRKTLGIVVLGAVWVGVGCAKSESAPSTTTTAAATAVATSAHPSAAPAPVKTAAPTTSAEKIIPAAKPPFESLMFKDSGTKGANGWPRFETYNLSTKTVTFAAVYGYAYDKSGKLVAKTTTPFNWNGMIKPGARADGDVDVGIGAKAPPAEAVTFELCYNKVKFEGDAKNTEDAKLCDDKRPKGAK